MRREPASWLGKVGVVLGATLSPLVKIHQPISPAWRWLLGVGSIVLLLAGYTWLSEWRHAENPTDRTLPTWPAIFFDGVLKSAGYRVEDAERVNHEKTPLVLEFGDGTVLVQKDPFWRSWFWVDFKTTYYRLFGGLLIGVIASVLVGVLMGCFQSVESFFFPPLAVLAKVPGTAMLPVFFVMVGTGEDLFLTMIAFGVFPTLAQAIYHAAKDDVPEEMLYKAATLGASSTERILNVIVPNIFPKILDAVRLQVGPAMVYLIAAELLLADVGFGYHMKLESHKTEMSLVYFYIAVLALTGFLLDRLIMWLRLETCPWYSETDQSKLILRPLLRRLHRRLFPWYPYPPEEKEEAKARA